MSGVQEKIFSTLGPKLRGNKALQDHGDKLLQIRIELIDYSGSYSSNDDLNICYLLVFSALNIYPWPR